MTTSGVVTAKCELTSVSDMRLIYLYPCVCGVLEQLGMVAGVVIVGKLLRGVLCGWSGARGRR